MAESFCFFNCLLDGERFILGCTGIFFYTLNHLAQEERNAFIHREIIILKEDDTQ